MIYSRCQICAFISPALSEIQLNGFGFRNVGKGHGHQALRSVGLKVSARNMSNLLVPEGFYLVLGNVSPSRLGNKTCYIVASGSGPNQFDSLSATHPYACSASSCEAGVVFQKHRTQLCSRDARSSIDKLWLQQVTNGGGLKKIQERLELLCLARRGRNVTLESAVQEVQKIKTEKLFGILTKAAQGQVLTFDQWITSLHKTQQPTVLSKPGEWLGKVWAMLPAFFTFKYKKTHEGAEKEYIERGVLAVKRCWNELKEKEDEDIDMGVVDSLCCYLPWLEQADSTAIVAKRQSLLKQRLPKASAKAAPKTKAKQTKDTAEKKAKDAAMAFLQKKKKA
eukprot:467796-Amphidinium_carterae.1